jgi:hypothetical protein
MRLRAYPEIGRRITFSQGRGELNRLAIVIASVSEAIPGDVERVRDSWIAASAFGLLAMTILSIRSVLKAPPACSRQACSQAAPQERMCAG